MTMIVTHEIGFAREVAPETFFTAPKAARTRAFLSKIL